MKSTMPVQLEADTLLRLISQLKMRGGEQDISAVINSAIELWLREQAALSRGSEPANDSAHDSANDPANDPASVRGYQWKILFLP